MDFAYNSKEFLTGTKEFLNSNSLIAKISFVILIIICFVILFNIGYWLISLILSPSRTPFLVDGMKDARVPLMIPQALNQKNAKPIYRSDNQYNGLEFTWSTWFYINDPTIGKPVKNIICACLTTWKTWDSFNLHFHFISLLYNLDEFHEIIIKLISLSMRQIHSTPNKRLTNEKVIDIYYKIINNENNKSIIDYKSSMQKANIKDIKSNFVSSYKTLHSEIIY